MCIRDRVNRVWRYLIPTNKLAKLREVNIYLLTYFCVGNCDKQQNAFNDFQHFQRSETQRKQSIISFS